MEKGMKTATTNQSERKSVQSTLPSWWLLWVTRGGLSIQDPFKSWVKPTPEAFVGEQKNTCIHCVALPHGSRSWAVIGHRLWSPSSFLMHVQDQLWHQKSWYKKMGLERHEAPVCKATYWQQRLRMEQAWEVSDVGNGTPRPSPI